MSRASLILALTALVALALLPFYAGEYFINLASQILIAAIFASSLNLLVGYGGLTSLGHAAFVGVSAYVFAWLTTHAGAGPAVAAAAALVGATIVACVFGLVALRATGLGFLMITLAFSQILWGLAYRWASVTNGDNGISGIPRFSPFGLSLDGAAAFYWFTLALCVIAFAAIAAFASSAFGAALRGTRDEPRRMAALGHDVRLIRWITFVYAGFWAGVAGLLYVNYNKFIHPSAMSITNSAEGLLAVIAGGSGTLAGPIVGATLIMLLKNYVSAYVERWNMLLGFVFVAIVLIAPDGVIPGLRRAAARIRGGRK
ncbi:MAG: branched-chain amino acid ABC transporter permease [Hyphomicrobiales bacterium]|nr:branched-chain amino acid ABC transporter permease [Hyphomicrobiales bacterium]